MIHAAGILFLSQAGRVLLLQRSDEGDMAGTWCIPGGKIEDGETPEQAAVREVLEETGYRAGHAGILHFHRVKYGVDFTTFLRRVEDEFLPKLNNEHTAYAWVTPDEVLPEPIMVNI